MSDLLFALWGIFVVVTLIDFYFRWRFNTRYLGYSVPSFTKKIEMAVTASGIRAEKVSELENTKYIFMNDQKQIWLQCSFRNNCSTLGLVKKYQLSPDGNSIIKDQTRLSIGVVFLILMAIPFLYLQAERFPRNNEGFDMFRFFPIFFGMAIAINFVMAFRRLSRESGDAISKLIKNQAK